MSTNESAPLTTMQALDRAKGLVTVGHQLSKVEQTISAAKRIDARRAAKSLKEALVSFYNHASGRDELVPVLEVLIEAASGTRRLITTTHELEILNAPGSALVWKGNVYGAERAAQSSQLHWIGPGLATATTILPSVDHPATVIFEPAP